MYKPLCQLIADSIVVYTGCAKKPPILNVPLLWTLPRSLINVKCKWIEDSMNLMISLKDVRSVLLVHAQRSLIEISCFCKFSAEKLDLLKHMRLLFCFLVHLCSKEDLCTLCLLCSPTKNSRMGLNQESWKAMKMVHPCLSIDWADFDRNILVLQGSSVAERHPAETSCFLCSFEAWETKNSPAFSGRYCQ